MKEVIYYDEIIEWKLLTALMNKDNATYLHRLTPEVFTDHRRNVFTALQSCFTKYGEVTYEGLNRVLNGKFPGELLVHNDVNVAISYDEALRLAKKRMVSEKAGRLLELSQEFDPDDAKIYHALNLIPLVSNVDGSLASGAIEFLGNLNAKNKGAYEFIRTGFRFMDNRMMGEWKPGSATVIAAQPGGGKTTFVANSMYNMATMYNIATLFISLEMKKDDLITKWCANALKIDSRVIGTGTLNEEEHERIEDFVVCLQTLPMYVIDNADLSLFQITKAIRDYVTEKNVKAVFIDYIQIVNHRPTGNRNYDLGEVAKVLRALGKELNIAIIILSQINRAGDGLDSIRDSGEIAQHADVVVLISFDESDQNQAVRTEVFEFLKNRFGPLNKVPVLFNGPYQRFEEAEG